MGTTEFDPNDITRRLYQAVSGPPGSRNWAAVEQLFHPEARLVRTGQDQDGQAYQLVMSFPDYRKNAEELLRDTAFHEEEVEQQALCFGNVAEIRSVYRYRFESPDEVRTGLGINLITMVCFQQGWQVMSIVWDNERDGLTLPAKL